MAARIRGLVMIGLGLLLGGAGYGLALALLGRPLPDWPGLRDLAPYLRQIAGAGAPGQGPEALLTVDFGLMALGAMALGGISLLGGVWQVLTGRNSLSGLLIGLFCLAGAGWAFLAT